MVGRGEESTVDIGELIWDIGGMGELIWDIEGDCDALRLLDDLSSGNIPQSRRRSAKSKPAFELDTALDDAFMLVACLGGVELEALSTTSAGFPCPIVCC